MDTFWELLKESVIMQGVITVMLIGTVCYLIIANLPIPPFLADTTSLVIGFYFGSKVAYGKARNEVKHVT